VAKDWDGSDAWFLESVAIADARGSADLSAVIETGDSVNHSVFNPEEIEKAVGRLLSAGLLTVDEDRFALTSEASELWHRSPSRYSLDRMRWLQSVLTNRYEFDPTASWSLDRRAWRSAFAAYQDRFSALIERVNDRQPRPDR
jgi:hypothetical protein